MPAAAENHLGQICLNEHVDSLHLMERTGEKNPMVTSRLRTCTQDQSGSNQLVSPESLLSCKYLPGDSHRNNSPSPTFTVPEKILYQFLDHHVLKNIPSVELILNYSDPLLK